METGLHFFVVEVSGTMWKITELPFSIN